MSKQNFNLFIYGSLREPSIFKSVCGLSFNINPHKTNEETLFGEPAFLSGYKRVSPDNVYFYAIKEPASKIEGFIIYNVPLYAIREIEKYEGKRYDRESVKVSTAKGFVKAQAYLVSH